MVITEVRITKLENSKVLAYAHVNFEGLIVPNFKVMNGPNGLWVANPSYKDHNNEYQSTAYALDKELRAYIQETVLNEYNGKLAPSSPGTQNPTEDDMPF